MNHTLPCEILFALHSPPLHHRSYYAHGCIVKRESTYEHELAYTHTCAIYSPFLFSLLS
jgi:hypothetical protein